MKYQKSVNLIIGFFLFTGSIFSFAGNNISGHYGDFKIAFDGKLKEESFIARNIHLLNSENEMDKVWYLQHTLDLNLHTSHGQQQYGYDVVRTKLNARNKARWGSPISIATTTR